MKQPSTVRATPSTPSPAASPPSSTPLPAASSRRPASTRGKIGKVYAGRNGILGALTEDLIDTGKESAADIRALRHTPAGAFGSARYKLKKYEDNPAQYERLIEVFRAHDIGYFFYNGGGDSADTCFKVSHAGREDGLPAAGHPRAEDRRQRPADHRLLPGFRLRRQVRRGVDPRGRLRRRLDGPHVDQGVRAGGDGTSRGLDRRSRRPRRAESRRRAAHHPVPRDRVRRSRLPRPHRGMREEVRLLRGRRLRRRAQQGRQVPGRCGYARRLRPRAAGRRRAGRGAVGQGQARLQVSLGRGGLPAARRAAHRFQGGRRAGLRGRQGRGRVRPARATTR